MATSLRALRAEDSEDVFLLKPQVPEGTDHIRGLLENTVDIITVLTPHGQVRYTSPATKRVLGYTAHEWINTEIFSYIHPGDEAAARAAFAQTLQNLETARTEEFRFRHREGSWHTLEVISTAVREEKGETGIVINARDISERAAQTAALRYQTTHDALTDLLNRTSFRESLQQAILAARQQQKPLALLVLDLDRFREINGTFDHRWGDFVLQQVGARLRRILRKSDPIARLGGDEFATLLSTMGDRPGAQRVARRILRMLESPFVIEGLPLAVSASIGIALYPEHGDDVEALMRRADIAMYTAKHKSSGYAFYTPEQDRHSPERLLLGGELRHAIERDQLCLYYQPKVSFATGQVNHVEALIRWQHPQHGFMLPDQFVPLAEQTGLIKPLFLWVLNRALHQCAVWQREGLALHVAVNLSMRNLHDPHLPDTIAELLTTWNLEPIWLELEITESTLAADPARALEILTRLEKMGVRIVIDDFGTGYSSLSYIKQLPVDEIKIDKSFVLGMTTDENDATIVRSTIELGHNLGLKVVAEGIENQATWDLLATWQCDFAQGYYLSQPLSPTEFTGWLRDFLCLNPPGKRKTWSQSLRSEHRHIKEHGGTE